MMNDKDIVQNFSKTVVFTCKFAVKLDFSSGDCKKLSNWVKITHQNADMLQSARKIFLHQVLKKNCNLYYNVI